MVQSTNPYSSTRKKRKAELDQTTGSLNWSGLVQRKLKKKWQTPLERHPQPDQSVRPVQTGSDYLITGQRPYQSNLLTIKNLISHFHAGLIIYIFQYFYFQKSSLQNTHEDTGGLKNIFLTAKKYQCCSQTYFPRTDLRQFSYDYSFTAKVKIINLLI